MKINQVGGTSQVDLSIKNVQQVKPKDVQRAPEQAPEVMDNPISVKEYIEEAKEVDSALLQKSVDQANKTLKQFNRHIEREVHEVTRAVMYKLKDNETNEVIAEFPPKKIQDMIAKMWELAGLFVDEKA